MYVESMVTDWAGELMYSGGWVEGTYMCVDGDMYTPRD